MEPAASIIARLGGEAEVARVTNTAITSPYRWQSALDKKGGTGGRIPQRHIPAMLAHAKLKGVALALEDFFPGLGSQEPGAIAS